MIRIGIHLPAKVRVVEDYAPAKYLVFLANGLCWRQITLKFTFGTSLLVTIQGAPGSGIGFPEPARPLREIQFPQQAGG